MFIGVLILLIHSLYPMFRFCCAERKDHIYVLLDIRHLVTRTRFDVAMNERTEFEVHSLVEMSFGSM